MNYIIQKKTLHLLPKGSFGIKMFMEMQTKTMEVEEEIVFLTLLHHFLCL